MAEPLQARIAAAIADHLCDARWPDGQPMISIAQAHCPRIAEPIAAALLPIVQAEIHAARGAVIRTPEEEAELDGWIKAVSAGTDDGHQHCPDCGCDPDDHTLHTSDCRRGSHPDLKVACTNPDGSWNPWPDDTGSAGA